MHLRRCPQCNDTALYVLEHEVTNDSGTFNRTFFKLMCGMCGHCLEVLTST